MARMYRQGDVLLVSAAAVPEGANKTDNRVLVVGEVTGHSHRITGQVSVFKWKSPSQAWRDEETYLSVTEAELVHEEHGAIQVPSGIYQVRRQREYDPAKSRFVMD